jgi:hypothetical protein
MGRIFLKKEVGPQTLSTQIGFKNRLRNGFHDGLLLGKIDSEELIKEAFHCPYLKRNWRIKSRLPRQAGGGIC